MKNIFLLLFSALFMLVGLNASAQYGKLVSDSNKTFVDTVTNTTTKTKFIKITGYQDVITIQANIEKISGTVAGSVWVSGSIDGSYYQSISDTLTATNVAKQSRIWTFNPSLYSYYKVNYKGSGTMSAKLSSFAIWRKKR